MHNRQIIRSVPAFIIAMACLTVAATHPVLLTANRLAQLSASGNAEWTTIKKYCDDNLNKVIGADYAGWGWRTAVENYTAAYRVTLPKDPTLAASYGKKAIAMMKVLARHHNYGGPDCAQFI